MLTKGASHQRQRYEMKEATRGDAERERQVDWRSETGSGELTIGERAWTSAYSASSRFHGVWPWLGYWPANAEATPRAAPRIE